MTGPEHYREAERILAEQEDSPERMAHLAYACAQVHATLALAAAQGCNEPTAIIHVDGDLTGEAAAMIRAQLASRKDGLS
jgi:hypothetical protein